MAVANHLKTKAYKIYKEIPPYHHSLLKKLKRKEDVGQIMNSMPAFLMIRFEYGKILQELGGKWDSLSELDKKLDLS